MPLLDRKAIVKAVDLQHRSYLLLRWMGEAIERGFIVFDTAHEYATLPEAAQKWILRHYNDIPPGARPGRADIDCFAMLFTTFLQSSFDLVSDPGMQRYSPDAHCFCPMCSWLVDAPNLKTKKPSAQDKRKAKKLMHDAIRETAAANAVVLTEDQVAALADMPELSEQLALTAYGRDLLQRMRGVSIGPASLVLWRTFAWKKAGSPKKDFVLTAELIFESERALLDQLPTANR